MTLPQTPPPSSGSTGEAGPTPEQRMMRWFLLAGGGIVIIGVVVVLVMALSSGIPGDEPDTPAGPEENLPPLAQACPPPTSEPEEPGSVSEPEGDRTVDTESGISYAAYGEPWQPWNQTWVAGDLQVEYATGQSFVTENYSDGQYLASILSGHVPAAVNDGTQLDLECVSDQVAGDVRASYYPEPNEMESIRDEAATLGGRPAWLRVFRLSFSKEGLSATDELVGVALIDVGRAEAAVLYVSVPGTHSKEWDHVVDEAIESVYPIDG